MASIVIWDRFIRVFHWSTVSIFFLNRFITEDDIHEYLGYGLIALLLARVFWGFYGPKNAHFASFFPTLSSIKHHLIKIKAHRFDRTEGHNPIGGIMILTLLCLLFSLCISGWMMGLDSFWGEDWLEETHEILANLTLITIIIHIAAVLVMSKITSINLIKTMLTGSRKL